MLTPFPVHYPPGLGPTDAKMFAQFGCRPLSACEHDAHRFHLRVGELRRMMALAALNSLEKSIGELLSLRLPSLGDLIRRVGRIRPKKKVSRVTARRVVAPVENEDPCGNISNLKRVGKTMGENKPPLNPHPPIPIHRATRKRPAGIGAGTLINLGPKANFYRLLLDSASMMTAQKRLWDTRRRDGSLFPTTTMTVSKGCFHAIHYMALAPTTQGVEQARP